MYSQVRRAYPYGVGVGQGVVVLVGVFENVVVDIRAYNNISHIVDAVGDGHLHGLVIDIVNIHIPILPLLAYLSGCRIVEVDCWRQVSHVAPARLARRSEAYVGNTIGDGVAAESAHGVAI